MRLIILLLVNMPAIALAASGAHGDDIPFKMIISQSINLLIALGVVVYFSKNKVKELFKNRLEDYHKEVKKAEEAKSQAEKKKREISERLNKLKSNQQESINHAKAEAEVMKNKIIADAENLSRKLAEEAKRTYEFECMRANESLRQELLSKAVVNAEDKLKDEVDGTDLKRMRIEFVEKIQVVPR
ncbi:MAG: ATP synthase F0 subunit B [Bdellovibrionales bacterium]|nr:ATP synthase F0 subunit B [Bdellovibrionales bacterium]